MFQRGKYRRAASLLILLFLLVGTSLAALASQRSSSDSSLSTFTFVPGADAYVTSSYPLSNFGSSPSLRVDSLPLSRTYLRFTVKGLNGYSVQSAKLRFYANSASALGLSVHALSSDTWGESAITYRTAPPAGSTIHASGAFKAGAWISVDVSSYVRSDAVYSFTLTTSSNTAISLASREVSGKAPRLIVTALVPATPTIQADWQPSFPIRAAFYYPWFPQAWTQQSIYPYTNYHPKLGFYSSADASILQKHIAMMQYGKVNAGIASWWGQGSQTDSKIPGLLKAAAGTRFRWALYYEMESHGDPTPAQIKNDLTYVRDHYGKDPNFLRVNGKFVVFVYADGHDGCGMADRWKQGNVVGAYVVLKVFPGYSKCASQPDAWHQYSPAVAEDQQGHDSFSISPGFWLVGNNVRLSRSVARWTQDVKDMVAAGTKWQLITTFSEWGEGTAVEPAKEWSSTSGYGQYLDVLHYNGNMP